MSYSKAKGRSNKTPFAKLPHRIMEHPNYASLSAHSVRLLIDFIYQYRGSNNGDLSAAFSVLKKQGWRSASTLNNSLQELQHCGLIQLTRQGGRHKTSLYALTWEGIDECGGKIDISACKAPSNLWKVERDKFKPKPKTKIKKGSRYVNQSSRYVNQLRVVGGEK